MIPHILLDDERYSEIVEKAMGRIQTFCPEWTDYNRHDPGIMLLELLAWQKEMQQFHLDQMGEEHERKYQKLFGIRTRGKIPAETEVCVRGLKEQTFFLKGSRFYAENICFEATEENVLERVSVKMLVYEDRRKERHSVDVAGKKLRFPAFGEHPQTGDTLYIGLDAPLTSGVCHKLFIHIFWHVPKARNPFCERFVPLAEYTLCYYGKTGWHQADLLSDTTYQMLADGFLSFSVAGEMERGERGLYWLCLRLVRSGYDLPPIIENISFSCLKVRQICTFAEYHEVFLVKDESFVISTYLACEGECAFFCEGKTGFYKYGGAICREQSEAGCAFSFPDLRTEEKKIFGILLLYEKGGKDRVCIAEGNAMPNQTYPVKVANLSGKELALLVETKKGSGCYTFWSACDDFDASSPTDRHFHFNERTGEILFGDCDHGFAPEGKILLVRGFTTLGAAGNVKAASISRSWRDDFVTNERDASGGEDLETAKQRRERFLMLQKERVRAVTFEDFEYLTKRTPGLAIENVRAVSGRKKTGGGVGEETVFVVVKPYSLEKHPMLSEACRRNIQTMLEPRRMIGTKIKVVSPVYIGVMIFVKILASVHMDDVKEEVRHVLKSFFDEIRADFGCTIPYSGIYGMIDVLEGVSGIESLSLDAQGKDILRSKNGDILLPANGLAYLRESVIC